LHTNADVAVPPENSVLYYLALRAAGVAAELHIYEQGTHGLGLAQSEAALSTWPLLLERWMEGRDILRRKDSSSL
jgi:acetyl esterase/lipase